MTSREDGDDEYHTEDNDADAIQFLSGFVLVLMVFL